MVCPDTKGEETERSCDGRGVPLRIALHRIGIGG
jgi:hypothetical protein